MGNSGGSSRKKLWISISVAVLAVLLLITIIVALNRDESKFSVKDGQTIYKVKVTSTKVNDTSDWEIKGTTSAPDGAKLFATYGDKTNDEEYGVNAASSTSLTSWSTVRNGKFTMIVSPLFLHYEKEYKSGKNISAYLFAITGLSGKLSEYSTEPKISNDLKSAIAKNIKKTNLSISDSQASYYNSLGKSEKSSSSEDSDESTSSSSSESSSSSSEKSSDKSSNSNETAKDLTTGTWSVGKDFDKGYYKITSTGGSGNISTTNSSSSDFNFSAILGTDVDNDIGQVNSYTGFFLKNTEFEISGLQGVHLEPVDPTKEIDISNVSAGDYIVGGAIPAGRYTISAVQGSGNVTSTSGLNEIMGTQTDSDDNQISNTTVNLKSGDILTTNLQEISLTKK
ncbi:hypothetical protein QMA60_04205 [Leuconostoc suionicum]|uniref:hypothetical protein n=1 Tax=Leuconostoc suionicum TaxID=1511761 RepID=UPI0024AE4C9B|nr:hypothetical protein [Leuconostoc suionicum]MDI6501911.1 hypothetical protein [Leuconostoc suionicum]MDI6664824.1 hypothetical protein [Leuconostoc suionicum]